MIKITPEVRVYLAAIAEIGEHIGETAREYGIASSKLPNGIEEIRKAKDEYLRLLKDFELQEESLLQIDAPDSLKREHSNINQSYSKYVVSTETSISALDIENVTVNEELLEEAQRLQVEAAQEIVEVSNDVVKKFVPE